MTDNEILKQILAEMQEMKADIKELKSDVSSLKSDVSTLKTDVAEIKTTVNKNYDKTLEFYGEYKENMTDISEKLDNLGARQEIFENQTIKNTAELRRIK